MPLNDSCPQFLFSHISDTFVLHFYEPSERDHQRKDVLWPFVFPLRILLSNYCPINPTYVSTLRTHLALMSVDAFCSQSASLSDRIKRLLLPLPSSSSSCFNGLQTSPCFFYLRRSKCRWWNGKIKRKRRLTPDGILRKAHSIKINPLILKQSFSLASFLLLLFVA